MNFVRYNPDTGAILEIGYMHPSLVQQEIDEGKPTVFFDGYITRETFCVDLDTKELKEITPVNLSSSETPDNNMGS